MELNFDEIRSFRSDEIPGKLEQLSKEEAFLKLVGTLFPMTPKDQLEQKILGFRTTDDIQKEMVYPFLKFIEANMTKGVDLNGLENIDVNQQYLFISNHRDIVLDSAFFAVKLLDNSLETVEIAMGDNLLIVPWIEQFVRINKSFIVQRGLSAREVLESSIRLSAYLRYVLHEKKNSLWIAQREGRAKDSDDRTQESLLKMFNLGGTKDNLIENLKELNICPLSISYEYDPCDYLKAREFQQKRDDPDHKKTPGDDLYSMKTGVMGYKGKVSYHITPCINDELDKIAAKTTVRNEQIELIAQLIDKRIHANYRIAQNNKIAYDLISEDKLFAEEYAEEEKEKFVAYIEEQIEKVDVENKDEDYLRKVLYGMYANPLKNHLVAIGK